MGSLNPPRVDSQGVESEESACCRFSHFIVSHACSITPSLIRSIFTILGSLITIRIQNTYQIHYLSVIQLIASLINPNAPKFTGQKKHVQGISHPRNRGEQVASTTSSPWSALACRAACTAGRHLGRATRSTSTEWKPHEESAVVQTVRDPLGGQPHIIKHDRTPKPFLEGTRFRTKIFATSLSTARIA